MSSPCGCVLAFDFGLSRTGVAIGNTLTRDARALTVIHAKTQAERWAAIESLMTEYEPVFCVVGIPRHGDGTPNELTARCEKFARQLGGRFRVPCFGVDERFSSVVVDADDRQADDAIDDLAAQVILTQYFQENP